MNRERMNPKDWHGNLEVTAWTNGEVLIIEGAPPDEEEVHHCDEMGCGWMHVLYRANITPEQAAQFGYVKPEPVVESKPKGPSEARLKAMERQRAAGNDVITRQPRD